MEADAFSRALRLHQQGNLAQAAAIYEQIIHSDARHWGAQLYLGLAEHQAGRHERGIALIRQAIALNPRSGEAHFNLGIVLASLGLSDEAIACYEEALRLEPHHAQAHNNLGILFKSQGLLPPAERHYREAILFSPNHALAHNNLGNLLREQGRLAEAIACYRRALELSPQMAGVANNLGNALKASGEATAAIATYRRALALDPRFAEAHYNLGLALKDQGDLGRAIESFEEALRLAPRHVEAHHNISIALWRRGQMHRAKEHNEKALLLDPAHTPSRWQRSLIYLIEGDFEQGWRDYEARWALPGVRPRGFSQPRWEGTPGAGKTVFVYTEQGLGDTIQFLRYLPLVRQRVGQVVFECQPSLCGLVRRSAVPLAIDQLITPGTPLPHFDAHIPLLSLPIVFATTLATIPATIPYLSPDSALVPRYSDELTSVPGLKVGIAWQGNPANTKDAYRSIPLSRFEKLARVDGVHLVSLQVGAGAEQVAAAPFPLFDLGKHFDSRSLDDLAAALMSVDLVISVDTAVAHLAGALGVPVWALLPLGPDWRWLLERSDSPWYPSMRLFRQRQAGDWEEVLERVTAEIQSRF